MKRKMY
jgi:Ion transport protein